MSTKASNGNGKKPASPATNLIGMLIAYVPHVDANMLNLLAGGGAGMMEALVCHPLGLSDAFP